jgi:acetyl esterase/lipase
MNRRSLVALLSSALAACSPLSILNRLGPRDTAARGPLGVAYGPDPRQRLDLYAPAGRPETPVPLLMFFYGGAWNSGDRAQYAWAGQALASRGFVVAIADHRLAPRFRYPSFVEDGAAAVARARALATEHGGDPDRILLSGHSSGAYIAAMLAYAPQFLEAAGVGHDRVKAFAGLSGPYDFYPFDVPASVEAFAGVADPRMTQPVNLDLSQAPPTFIAHGSRDQVVQPRNTTSLARALSIAGRVVEMKIYPGLDHKDVVVALSRMFRNKAPVLDDMTAFLHRHAG